jgi:tol-pal system protein YbgF
LRQVEPESHEPPLSLSSSPEETLPPAAVGVVMTPSAQQASAATQPASEAEREAYHASYNLFREGNYTGAITQFESFLKHYPNSQLAPGAAYWIGNAYYALRDFGAAINAQQKVIENYPNSSKAPDAMLNIASNQSEMGEISAARKTLENLIAKYPNSDAAGKAKGRLANLR